MKLLHQAHLLYAGIYLMFARRNGKSPETKARLRRLLGKAQSRIDRRSRAMAGKFDVPAWLTMV